MDFDKFLQSLIDAKNKFLADCNAALKPMPPVEQFEATSIVACGISSLNAALQWITNTCSQMDLQLADYKERASEIMDDCCSKFMAAKIESGDVIPKAKIDAGDYLTKEVAAQTAQAAAEKAANDRETEVVARIQLLASRRTELCTAKMGADGKETAPALLPREIADKLPDDLLKADDYLAKAAVIASRLSEVQALGVNVPQLLARAHELPLDEAGTAQFNDQLTTIKTAVDGARKSAGGPTAPGATAPFAMSHEGAGKGDELVGIV